MSWMNNSSSYVKPNPNMKRSAASKNRAAITRARNRAAREEIYASPIAPAPFLLKPGREALDPYNRRVVVISKDGDMVKCRLGGTYGATLIYSASCLRPVTG